MALALKEIRARAVAFARDWQDAASERAEAQSFWNAVEQAGQAVLDARAAFPGETLANLYDPNLMPPALSRAHRTLDRAVDAAYGRRGFATEAERLALLFERPAALAAPLAPAVVPRQPRRRSGRPVTASVAG